MNARTSDDEADRVPVSRHCRGRAVVSSEVRSPLLFKSGSTSNLLVERVQNQIRSQSPGVSPIVHEDDDNIVIRRPITYGTINSSENDVDSTNAHRSIVARYRYYQRLHPQSNSLFVMPAHVVPADCFLILLPIKTQLQTQSSLITIFSIWNTMMGTSILSMPWALERAGFICGIILMVVMAGLTLYTAYLVMKSPSFLGLENSNDLDFSDVCYHYLGRWGKYLSVSFSVVALLGGTIVYWVLMSNFLYNSILYIYEKVNDEFNVTKPVGINGSYSDVYCPHPPEPGPGNLSHDDTTLDVTRFRSRYSSDEIFNNVWQQFLSVPFFLILVIAPLVNFKSPTFFTKFNALGTVSVGYILFFIAYKGFNWGVNMNEKLGIPKFQVTFPALTGILSLAYFIHNCVLSIVRNQRHPENNGRDLSIAFVCVCFTYVFVGVIFYITFPLPKLCIEDNLLNNFVNFDILAFVARIFLFFQMVTVFPLLMFVLRVQILNVFFGSIYPSLKHVLGLNSIIMAISLLFAIFLPKIGTIIRFSGALCGLVYTFTLPCIVYMLSLRTNSTLTWPIVSIHVFIILLGLLNFIAQFLILNRA